MNALRFRPEEPDDETSIFALTKAAFDGRHYASGNEAEIIDALRASGALTLSLVALRDNDIVAHIAFSPVTIDDEPSQWLGLGPVSVFPAQQGKGIGQALIRHSLDEVKGNGVQGVVLLGNPEYYRRFGFAAASDLHMQGYPPEYLMSLHLAGPMPKGGVLFHPAFHDTPRSD